MRARILIFAAITALIPCWRAFATEPSGDRYVVIMADDMEQAEAERLAAVYGGSLEEGTGGRRLVLRISAARAEMLRHDPHVVSVEAQGRHLTPRPTGSGSMTIGNYSYDGAGNITTIGQDQYVYDVLGRLTSAAAGAGNAQTYQYDPFGNRTTVTTSGTLCTGDTMCAQSGTYTAGSNHLSDNPPAGNPIAAYDPAGNLTAYGADQYAYDATGLLSRSQVSGQDRQYFYTAEDERIAVYDGFSNWRWTVRGDDGKVLREFTSTNSGTSLGVANRQWARDYIWRDGLLLATENRTASGGEVTFHYHLDHLGTPRLVTDGAGARVSTHTYYAFGAELRTSPEAPETAMKFTGHERDITGTSDALDDMHARYYSALQGRFLSVDPIPGNPYQPQSWNRYAYVENNPIARTDPTGQSSIDDLFQSIDAWWHKKMEQWFPPKQVPQDPNREALNDPAVGNTPAQTERLVNPAGTAQRGLNEAGATLGAEFTKQGILQIATVATPVLFRAALKPFNKELSVAGRALTKHPEVLGFADGAALRAELRTTAAVNEAGSRAVANILDNGIQTVINHPRYGQIIQVQIPGGFGARWSAATKEFIGFINP